MILGSEQPALDRAAVVTGGASGLGRAVAESLLRRGARVVIADLQESEGQAFAAAAPGRAAFVRADVTDESALREAIAAARALGPLRVWVSCAGIAIAEKVLAKDGAPHDLARFRRVIEVNLIGTFNGLRLAAAAMAANPPLEDGERGVIVNTASIAAEDGQIGQSAYAASKAGVAGLTLPAARELARQGIRVVAIAPGIFDTPLLAGLPEKARAELAASMPFPKRLGRPEEFAALVLHAIENRFLNGAFLRLDGALRMG